MIVDIVFITIMILSIHGPIKNTNNVGLILIKTHLVLYNAQQVSQAPNTESISLSNLALVKENPRQYSMNVAIYGTNRNALNMDIDSLLDCKLLLNKSVVLVETSTTRQDRFMELLLETESRRNKNSMTIDNSNDKLIIVASYNNNNNVESLSSNNDGYGMVGEIRISQEIHPSQIVSILENAYTTALRIGSNVPILLDLRDTIHVHEIERFIIQFKNFPTKSPPVVIISGACHLRIIDELFEHLYECNVYFVIDQIGMGEELLLSSLPIANSSQQQQQQQPVPSDEEVVHMITKYLTRDYTRFVLGVEIQFATQTRYFGGSGLNTAIKCLERLQRLGIPSPILECIAYKNALQLLSFHIPVQVPILPIETWPCAICHKQVAINNTEYYESHGERFCSMVCMREFRLKLAKKS
jgi:hypothetical protein